MSRFLNATRLALLPIIASGTLVTFAIAEQHGTLAPPPEVVANCQNCHGANGDSATGDVPRLNGQQFLYLEARLKDFRDPTREVPHATSNMWRVMLNIRDDSIPPIATYYSAQLPTPSKSSSPLASEGKRIFVMGAPGIPSCQSCHGAGGEGRGAVPRLAGQHAQYLKNQLAALSLAMRESDVMHPILNPMSEKQMDAIVAYLAGN